jgi:hypothetical protein
MTEESMQIGRSSRPAPSQHLLEQLGLVDERDARVDVEHVGAGLGLRDRVRGDRRQVAAAQLSAKTLRPVGLMRSPMMQKGCVGPIVTVLDRECRTVSMRLVPFGSGLDAQSLTELGDAGVLAERDEVQAGDAGLRARVVRELAGDLEALVLLVRRGLGAGDELGRHLDARDLSR